LRTLIGAPKLQNEEMYENFYIR